MNTSELIDAIKCVIYHIDLHKGLRQTKSSPTVEETNFGNDDDDDVVNDAVEGDGQVTHAIVLTLILRHYGRGNCPHRAQNHLARGFDAPL